MALEKRLTIFFAFLLPIVVLGCWALSQSVRVAAGTEVRLRVTGYDPRDLLSGHYLRYRVDFGTDVCAGGTASEDQTCVCLSMSPGNEVAQVLWSGTCAARAVERCPLYLRGHCEFSRFVAGIERFYFPESDAWLLSAVPPESVIAVSVGADGIGRVTQLFVGGVPLEEYVKEKRAVLSPKP